MTLKGRRHQGGFTLIELLVVVAIISIIASLIIPYLIDGLQKAKQKRTVGDMRNVGTCWMSWLTDQVSAGAAGASPGSHTYDISQLTEIDRDDLFASLYQSQSFFYCQDIPGYDGWGYGFQYFQNTETLLGANVMAIRSAGRDSDSYEVGAFVGTNYDLDMVWADGLFIRYPAGIQAAEGNAG